MNYTHKYTYTLPPDVISCSALLHNLHKRSVPTRFRWCICICMQIFHNFETNHVSKDRMKDVQVFQKPLELPDPRLCLETSVVWVLMGHLGTFQSSDPTHHFTLSHGKRHGSSDRWYCFSSVKAPPYGNCSLWIWITSGKYALKGLYY